MRAAAILALLALAACSSGPVRPVEIDGTEMCSRCHMAISEMRYAGEFLDHDGTAWKFDDIGCLVRYTKDHRLDRKSETYFVMDYGTRHWLDGRKAVYVHSSEIQSPMFGGLAAFSDRARAEEFARGVHGQVLTFEELWTSQS